MANLLAKLLVSLLVLLDACSAKPMEVDYSGRSLRTRASFNEESLTPGGILFVDGKQTSCELVTIDSKASFVSANCLKYISGGTVDLAPRYEVFIDGALNSSPRKYTVQKITSHPKYDPATFANNIAVLEYNTEAPVVWNTSISVDKNEWSDIVFGRHNLKDADRVEWSRQTLTVGPAEASLCKESSPLYSAHSNDYLCNSLVVTSAANSSCQVPYGAAYGVVGSNLYPIGLYSHTAVYGGNSLCTNSKLVSYYTLIMDYHAFGSAAIGRPATYYSNAKTVPPKFDSNYAVKAADGSVPRDVKYVGGDIYALQRSALQPTSSSSSALPTGTNTSGSTQKPSSNGGLPQKTIIIIAVCASVGAVILLAGLVFLVKWLAKRRRVQAWKPAEENNEMLLLTSEIGGASIPSANANRFTSGISLESTTEDGLPTYTSAVARQLDQALSTGDDKQRKT